ncbi:MAG TPA: mycofactocin system FadH/OYE family oxidoreductase 1 [Acidimicrobiales bacterium]|nr:mycofactocin system FadH/OYE family oxidoreductase 1 [Acidimicrobiales bacterium]
MRVRLLEPVDLGSKRAPNRLLFGPHETNLGIGRALSARHVAYYERRAAGGCGTVVTETASVHPGDWPYERAPLAAECFAGWSAVADAVHAHGGLALAALGHCGGQGSSAYSQRVLWAPSRVADPVTREVPQEMEEREIAAVTEGFATAAALAAASGLDGVEVNAASFSLLRHFLSGLTNTRIDAYGVDRLRFAREVLEATRAALGEGPVLGLRLGCDELAPWAGITPESGEQIALALGPLADYVVAVRAPAYDQFGARPDGHTPPGFALPLAGALRRALPAPVAVVAQGSIVEVTMAEQALTDGTADLVEMTRAQIADPELGAKLARGAGEEIRPCVLCNQRCLVRDPRNPLVSCIGEPSSGFEWQGEGAAIDEQAGAAAEGEVLVVGAGPAGLEAARVAALTGWRVRVVDRRPRAGGVLRAAAAGAGRHRLELLADWLEAECRRLGVAIELSTSVDPGDLSSRAASGGHVLVCTGSVPGPLPDADGSVELRTALEVLELAQSGRLGELAPGPVVVDDPVGDAVGISVAELLAAAGRPVTLITGDAVAGTQLSRTGDLAPANTRLARAGVRIVKRSLVVDVGGGVVRLQDRYTGKEAPVAAAVLVRAAPALPDDALWDSAPAGARRAGDAVAPRTVYEAVLEGRRAALAIGGRDSLADP